MQTRIILGVDPGSVRTGFGLIQIFPTAPPKLITYGAWQLKQYATFTLRMQHIYRHMVALLQEYTPDEMAIESVFQGKNVQSMLKLGRAQGVAIAAAIAYTIPLIEYAPCKVKQAITGQGNASKAQVAAMVGRLLEVSLQPIFLDASDALAIALCHGQQRPTSTAPPKQWAQFVAKHPHRVVSRP
ncbi:MAG: crossover junction endodeoxyribonuclease RuvC [Candidatus Cardinium sp.]|nr:crossover junction endodeoxyribonuclease RuvC [Candidatus Cardinium sp.]